MSEKTFNDLFKQESIKTNTLTVGTVLNQITLNGKDYYVVGTDLKSEVYIAKSEFITEPIIGSVVDIYIQDFCDKEGKTIGSFTKATSIIEKTKMIKDYKNRLFRIYESKVMSIVNGGYILLIRNCVKVFLPKSRSEKNKELKIGNTVFCKIISLEREDIIVASYTLDSDKYEVGSIIERSIKKIIVDKGIIISLESDKDIIVHNNNLLPFKTYTVNDIIKLKVKKIKKDGISIALSERDIYIEEFNQFKVNEFYEVLIYKISEKGYIVSLTDNILGFLTYTNPSDGMLNKKVKALVTFNKNCLVYLLMKTDNKRAEEVYKIGEILEGCIIDKKTRFAIVRIENFDAIIFSKDFHVNGEISEELFKNCNIGDKLSVKINWIDKHENRIFLVNKNIIDTKNDLLNQNQVFKCIVKHIVKNGYIVSIDNEKESFKGFISQKDLNSFTRINIGSKIDAKISHYDERRKLFILATNLNDKHQKELIDNLFSNRRVEYLDFSDFKDNEKD